MVAAKLHPTSILIRVLSMLIMLATLAAITVPRHSVAAPAQAPTDPGPVPRGATARISKGQIDEMIVSPDEKRIAVSTYIGIYMYDAATMRQMWYVESFNFAGWQPIAFSPDSKRLVGGRNGKEVIAWNVENGAIFRRYHSNFDALDLAYSKDGKSIIGIDTGADMRVWNAATGRQQYLTNGGFWTATAPDNTMFATGAYHSVYIYDMATGANLFAFDAGDGVGEFEVVEFSPDSQLIAAGSETGRVMVWNAKTGAFLYGFDVPGEQGISAIKFSADGTQMAVGAANVQIFNPLTGQLLQSYDQLPVGRYSPYFAKDGVLKAHVLTEYGFALWDVYANTPILTSTAHALSIYDAALAKDGTMLVLARGPATIERWNAVTRERLGSFKVDDEVVDLVLSHDSTKVALVLQHNDSTSILVADAATGQPIMRQSYQDDWTREVMFSPDDAVLYAITDTRRVNRWDVATGALLSTYGAWNTFWTFAPDGKTIAFWDEEVTYITDAESGNILTTIDYGLAEDDYLTTDHGVFSADGTKFAMATYDQVWVWDTKTGKRLFRFNWSADYIQIWTMAFSADGKKLAAGTSTGHVMVWSMTSGARLRTWRGQNYMSWVGFNPAGQLLSAAGDGTVVYWPRP